MIPDHLHFQCNICGHMASASIALLTREEPTCVHCSSTVRMRSIIHLLSVELFGVSLCLDQFPVRKDLRGVGMSDWETYADVLATKFDYTNTYYHKEPFLDICRGDADREGRVDFVLSSDVFEHVNPPVAKAFQNLRRLLTSRGVVIFSVPYSKEEHTVEHFPDLYEYTIKKEGDHFCLVNVTRDGTIQVFDKLVFHGGPGSTIEMRVFSEKALRSDFAQAGFMPPMIFRDPYYRYGIVHAVDWSLPMTVRPSA